MKYQLPAYIYGHWLFSDPVKFQWWLRLLSMICDKDSVIEIKGVRKRCVRGSVFTTQGELAKAWGTTCDKVQAFLRKLESKGEIKRKTDAKLTEIKVLNIADYDVLGRNLDAKLTQSDHFDAILTEIKGLLSTLSGDVRRKVDAIFGKNEDFDAKLTEINAIYSEASEDDRRNLDAILEKSLASAKKSTKRNIYSYIYNITFPNGNVSLDKSKLLFTHAHEVSGVEASPEDAIILDEVAAPGPPAPEKKKKARKPPKEPSAVTKGRQVFEKVYLERFDEPYYWSAKDASNMKQLLDKIAFSRKNRDNPLPVDDESVIIALDQFLHVINKEWIINNFTVSVINSQYGAIVSELRNRKNGNSQNKQNSGRATADDVPGQKNDLYDDLQRKHEQWKKEREGDCPEPKLLPG